MIDLAALHGLGGCGMLTYARYVVSLFMLCVFGSFHFIPSLFSP